MILTLQLSEAVRSWVVIHTAGCRPCCLRYKQELRPDCSAEWTTILCSLFGHRNRFLICGVIPMYGPAESGELESQRWERPPCVLDDFNQCGFIFNCRAVIIANIILFLKSVPCWFFLPSEILRIHISTLKFTKTISGYQVNGDKKNLNYSKHKFCLCWASTNHGR